MNLLAHAWCDDLIPQVLADSLAFSEYVASQQVPSRCLAGQISPKDRHVVLLCTYWCIEWAWSSLTDWWSSLTGQLAFGSPETNNRIQYNSSTPHLQDIYVVRVLNKVCFQSRQWKIRRRGTFTPVILSVMNFYTVKLTTS